MQIDSDLIPVTAIVLALSIPIIAIIFEYFTKKSQMRVMEKAIEKGMPLEGLSLSDKKGPRMPYRAGMITVAVGLGVGIFAVLVALMAKEALYPLLGLAAIPTLVGLALIINDRINYSRLFNKGSDPQESS